MAVLSTYVLQSLVIIHMGILHTTMGKNKNKSDKMIFVHLVFLEDVTFGY